LCVKWQHKKCNIILLVCQYCRKILDIKSSLLLINTLFYLLIYLHAQLFCFRISLSSCVTAKCKSILYFWCAQIIYSALNELCWSVLCFHVGIPDVTSPSRTPMNGRMIRGMSTPRDTHCCIPLTSSASAAPRHYAENYNARGL